MIFRVEVTLRREERAFERLVGLVGRRGYELVGVSADLVSGGTAMVVQLTLESDRPKELLARQLARLRQVTAVRLG